MKSLGFKLYPACAKRVLVGFFIAISFSLSMYSCQEDEAPKEDDTPDVIEKKPAKIGDLRGGGIVFWVDPSDSTKGLVVALSDLYAAAQWGCQGKSVNGANKTNITGGAQNTRDILRACRYVNIAADLCDEAVDNGYSDWYLANSGEWAQIVGHLAVVEAAAEANGGRKFYDVYWTSNQPNGVVGESQARAVDIRKNHFPLERKDGRLAVRAVRYFKQ